MPSRTPASTRRDEILKVALELFATKGIEGTGLREIADRIGVSQPALYHYFDSKDSLVEAIVAWRREHAADKQAAVVRRLAKATTLRQGLVTISDSLAELWHSPENQDFHRLLFSEMTHQGPLAQRLSREFLEPTFRWVEGLFASLIKLGKVRDLDPGLLAVQFVAPLVMMGLWQQHHGENARERFAQLLYQHLEVTIRGIEAR